MNDLLAVEWPLIVEGVTWLIKFFVIYTYIYLWGHLSGSKNSFIAGPKIHARRHFLTKQIRIFDFFLEPKYLSVN